MADVKWIKIKVGLFDGTSFKRIKKASIGGESFRDKLTAIWFELLDLGAKCNNNGLLYSDEIPYGSFEDIAIMIDRDPKEVELCMNFFISNGMIEIIDDLYKLSNWDKYQNKEVLEEIREKNRIRQKRYYDNHKQLEEKPNVRSDVSSNVSCSISNSISKEDNKRIKGECREEEKKEKETTKRFVSPTVEEVRQYCLERKNSVNPEQFVDFYTSKGWKVGNSPMKDWKACVRTWERSRNDKATAQPPKRNGEEKWGDNVIVKNRTGLWE